jgi:hypothetical protein
MNKKDKKKPKKGVSSERPGEGADADGESASVIPTPRKAVEMTAEELADEEWGPVKEKGKKAKKGKHKAKTPEDNDEENPGEHGIWVSICNFALHLFALFKTLLQAMQPRSPPHSLMQKTEMKVKLWKGTG